MHHRGTHKIYQRNIWVSSQKMDGHWDIRIVMRYEPPDDSLGLDYVSASRRELARTWSGRIGRRRGEHSDAAARSMAPQLDAARSAVARETSKVSITAVHPRSRSNAAIVIVDLDPINGSGSCGSDPITLLVKVCGSFLGQFEQ